MESPVPTLSTPLYPPKLVYITTVPAYIHHFPGFPAVFIHHPAPPTATSGQDSVQRREIQRLNAVIFCFFCPMDTERTARLPRCKSHQKKRRRIKYTPGEALLRRGHFLYIRMSRHWQVLIPCRCPCSRARLRSCPPTSRRGPSSAAAPYA